MLPTYSSRNDRSLLLFTRKSFRAREKFLIVLVFLTFCFVCFCGLFYLPEFGSKNRVLDVYKQFQRAGPEMFIPAPPIDKPNHHHHHQHHGDDRPDNGIDAEGHIIDRAKLAAKIREELGDLNLDRPETQKSEREREQQEEHGRMIADRNSQQQNKPEENIVLAPPNQIEENKNVLQAGGAVGGSGLGDNHPVPIPHSDSSDISVTEKRNKVREVSVAGWLIVIDSLALDSWPNVDLSDHVCRSYLITAGATKLELGADR